MTTENLDHDYRIAVKWYQSIQFTKTEAAKILNFSTATLSNREAKGVFPPAKKVGARQKYSVVDVMRLMLIEYDTISIQRLFVGAKAKMHLTENQMRHIPSLIMKDLIALQNIQEHKAA